MDKRYLKTPEGLVGDDRLTPMRDGVAAVGIRDQVSVKRYADGKPVHISAPVCVLKSRPEDNASIETQLLLGEDFIAYGAKGDWVWGQAVRDHYVGWVRKSHLVGGFRQATHQVMSRGTFLYSDADLKSQPVMKIPMASQMKVTGRKTVRDTEYLCTDEGWLIKKHTRPLGRYARDFVLVAESMIGTSYLWAGRSTFGTDCSGIIQLAMQMAGIATLRDSDMQEATIGNRVSLESGLSGLKRGDLVFWPGHVGVMRDGETLLHANGHTMTVFSEPLTEAVDRIAYLYGKPRTVRRPFALSAIDEGQAAASSTAPEGAVLATTA